MLGFLSGDLLTTLVRLLPRAFMLGAPFALSLILIAALADAKIPRDLEATWRR